MRKRRGRLADDIDIIIDSDGWMAVLPDAERLVEQAAFAAVARAAPADIAIACAILLTDDGCLRDLNNRFRGLDKPTNVLSFPAGDTLVDENDEPLVGMPPVGGDIAIAFETTAWEAEAQGKSLADHLRHLVVHGLLHLFGYDHEAEEEAETMEGLEREILAAIGVADPYAGERAEASAR